MFLLNCLGKIAEKIIAARLVYLVEITDLLHFDQISERRNYYYYSSSNLRAHGVCDYGTLPVM